jgi:hypothetical protein
LVLPWHEPLLLSKAVCNYGWRFTGKLSSDFGFAFVLAAGRCSWSARAAIAVNVTTAGSASASHVSGSIRRLIGDISGASSVVWIIATGSVPIVADSF